MPLFGRKKKAIDPVCKMEVDPKKAAAEFTYKGTTYYFCAVACKKEFEKDPEKFLSGAAPAEMPH